MHHPHAMLPARQVTFLDLETGAGRRYMLPPNLEPNLTSGELASTTRMLLHDEQLSAPHNQALAVVAASALVERDTARSAPLVLVKLLLQELDRVNAVLSVQSRRIANLVEMQDQARAQGDVATL